ncbi:MucR family transcriptional regulator [Pseudovibrio sp. WM33]|uniref:MucR family transcriptional regulator n=1 Tax=Pseudovibrio sp. WM33 TaxID=1735585 RepID=UPI0007AE830E|nr:MucR family transcriptional regulator [Pseudovibrio sp. WM33]KZL17609.1 ROS/MUCR transcriptional regulator protein [Pseudovibrio sp. WM33]
MLHSSPKELRFKGGSRAASKKMRHVQRAKERRRIKQGYPRTTPFKSREEVEAYFSEERLTCLLCGKKYLKLGVHLLRIHDTTTEDYKQKYGIPNRVGLVCSSTWERYSKHAKAVSAVHGQETAAAAREKLRQMPSVTYKRLPEWLTEERTERVLAGSGSTRISQEMIDRFLTAVSGGKIPTELFGREGFPSRSGWHSWCKEHPEDKRRFVQIWEALPFPIQAKGQRLGIRFKKDVKKLWLKGGNADHEIAALLGVSTMAVNRVTCTFRKSVS